MGKKADLIKWGEEVIWFQPEEFEDPDHLGSWVHMEAETIYCLEGLRVQTGWPIITHNKYNLHGCVSVAEKGHTSNSRHYISNACDAVDWHFDTDANARDQASIVLKSPFTGIGVYYDWNWDGKKLNIGFHTDLRSKHQYWNRKNGQYFYLLN